MTPGSATPRVFFRALDADGLPVETIVAGTAGLSLWYLRPGGLKVPITGLSDLATLDAAWVAGGLKHVDDGWYLFCPPAAAVADGVEEVLFGGLATDVIILSAPVPLVDVLDAAAVWAYATRTLTQTAAAVAAALAGSTINIRRGDTLTVSITGLGDLTARTKLWIAGKADRGHPDTAAVFVIEETADLQVINGSTATTPTNGTLTVTDAVAGNLTIVLAGVETAKLAELTGGVYDVQILEAAGPRTLTDGTLNVTLDVTRAVT